MTAVPLERSGVAAIAVAALAGVIFGAGLVLAKMTDPARVIGFLDVTRAWDPHLVFVLGGAVTVHFGAWQWMRARERRPWFDARVDLPARRDVDLPLVLGGAIFGVGWGLSGVCPGPGLVTAAAGNTGALVFVGTMLAGMLLARPFARP